MIIVAPLFTLLLWRTKFLFVMIIQLKYIIVSRSLNCPEFNKYEYSVTKSILRYNIIITLNSLLRSLLLLLYFESKFFIRYSWLFKISTQKATRILCVYVYDFVKKLSWNKIVKRFVVLYTASDRFDTFLNVYNNGTL